MCGGLWEVCCVTAIVKDSVFGLGVWTYVVCLCKGCDGCCVFVSIVTRGAVGHSSSLVSVDLEYQDEWYVLKSPRKRVSCVVKRCSIEA